MNFQTVNLAINHTNYISKISIIIPDFKDDDYIKSLFWELFGVRYNEEYCSYDVEEIT